MTKRIIFIPGIKTYQWYLSGWKRDLAARFPDREVIFLDDTFYLHYQHKKLVKIVDKGVALLLEEKPTLILAHSFGGILAKAIIQREQEACRLSQKNTGVYKLVTMASPHGMTLFGVVAAKRALQVPQGIAQLPTVTLGGYMDPVVFFGHTQMPHSVHYNLWSEHLGFLLSARIRNRVIQELD